MAFIELVPAERAGAAADLFDALGVRPDAACSEPPPSLRDAPTVGRPVEGT